MALTKYSLTKNPIGATKLTITKDLSVNLGNDGVVVPDAVLLTKQPGFTKANLSKQPRPSGGTLVRQVKNDT